MLTDGSKIASILRTDKHRLFEFVSELEKKYRKSRVLEKIAEENEIILRKRLDMLGLGRNISAEAMFDALTSKIEADDIVLFNALNRPMCSTEIGCGTILDLAKKLADSKKGFFLKKEKAEELLRNIPPKNILKALGYTSADSMFKKEDAFEIFCALRFIEDDKWMNDVFFKQYSNLTPQDFEEREIILKAMPERWAKAAQDFVEKKYHNVSHLKELGVIFTLPVSLGISGETLRLLSLILHYYHEVHFYSEMFKKYAGNEETFVDNLLLSVSNKVLDKLPEVKDHTWLIIQSYLAKNDVNDWRLFWPHVNPEAIHWQKAENDIARLGTVIDGVNSDFAFWKDLDWVGDYFKDETGVDILVSFNFIDTIMSLVKEKELIKYLYHHQEAMWNKVFCELAGKTKLEETIKDNFLKGYISI